MERRGIDQTIATPFTPQGCEQSCGKKNKQVADIL